MFEPFKYFDWDDISETIDELDLSKLQVALLKRILKEIKVGLWFTDEEEGPRLKLYVCCGGDDINAIDIETLLHHLLEENWVQIGNEKEIIVLEKVKAKIDELIAQHKRPLDENFKPIYEKHEDPHAANG